MSRTELQPERTRGAIVRDGNEAVTAAKAACNTLSAALSRVGLTFGAPGAHEAHKATARTLAAEIVALRSPATPLALTPDPAADAAQQSEAVPEEVVIPTAPKAPRTRK